MWNAATLDPEHDDTLYVGTGDNYSDPVFPMSDAIVALKMSTGDILWWHLFTKDAWNSEGTERDVPETIRSSLFNSNAKRSV